ncbi:MAG TPA: aldehyde dehydrogenase family protein [Fimbriimonas sp.]|nr:aldehyde dehydrogenase family protein [Fimbriimonas sp.]
MSTLLGQLLVGGDFLGSACDPTSPKNVVKAPFGGAIVGVAVEGGWPEMEGCLEAASQAFEKWKRSSRSDRQTLLRRAAGLVRERSAELSELLCLEVAKPITWAKAEVGRLALTFEYAADLVSTYGLESIPLDMDPRGEGYTCTVERFPIGPIFCMVPYNWPFNLAAHKIAPALATGNTLVLKTSPLAPLCTMELGRLLHEAGAPTGTVNVWNGPDSHVTKAVGDLRVKMLSFTGSARVGWLLKGQLSEKKVLLELGGDAMVIVEPDASLEWAADRIVSGGYGYAGQVCISVQHVLAHDSIYDRLLQLLIHKTETCPTGDPMDPKTVCGPLISESAAEKVQKMVDDAVSRGARIVAGGGRTANLMRPTLIENVPADCDLAREEVFGPVVTISPYGKLDEAIARVNRSQYGIQTGLFTNDLRSVRQAYEEIETGGVIVNDYPTLRFDNMPYGGVKRSGFGREGVRYAMDEMTEPKALVTKTLR